MVAPVLPFIRPTFPRPEEWLGYLEPAYRKQRYSNFGPVHSALEDRLTAAYGSFYRQAILVSSGTAGITATLMAMEIQGRVLIPSFTFPATLQAVRATGCEAVFCDVCPDRWEMSADTLQAGLAQGDISCVLAVRSYGFCRDLSPIEDVCRDARVPLIIDSAAALGGKIAGGAAAGGQGAAEIFSLHATKVFGIGEGGVVFAPKELVGAIRTAINFGITQERVGRGFNGKLSEMACAVGLAMADRIACYIAARRCIADRYFARLGPWPMLRLPRDPGQPPWQSFPLQLPPAIDAGAFVERALSLGLELRRYYRPALHTALPGESRAPVSEMLARTMVCLPIYSDMTPREHDQALQTVETVLLELLNNRLT